MRKILQKVNSFILGSIMLLGAFTGISAAVYTQAAGPGYGAHLLAADSVRVLDWTDVQAQRLKQALPLRIAVEPLKNLHEE